MFESVFLGAVTSRYDTDAVLMAAGITAVITLGLTVFALQTRVSAYTPTIRVENTMCIF